MFRRLGIDRLGFAGRMAAIVLLATFAALALGSAVQFMDGRDDPPRATPLAQRIAAIVTLLKQTNGSARETVLQAANSDDLSVRIADKEIADLKDGERLAGVEWVVREFLDEPDKHDVVAVFYSHIKDRPIARFFDRFSPSTPSALKVSVLLDVGQYVMFETRGSPARRIMGIPPGFIIGVVGALLAVLAVLAVMREAKPLQQLAQSVTAFGGDAAPRNVTPSGAPDLRRLISAVNDMQGRIAQLVTGRTVLLGAISHDLRTFITRLRLRVESLEDDDMRERAARDLESMSALLDDSLALAKSSQGDDGHEPVDLVGLLRDEINDRVDQDVTFLDDAADQAIVVQGDDLALRRLFNNLIDNGVRYGERVSVSVVLDQNSPIVTVDDDGPGVPANERHAIFTPFYRLEASRSRETGGSGLGLAIAQQIARSLHAEISVGDAPSGGARFRVRFPDGGDDVVVRTEPDRS